MSLLVIHDRIRLRYVSRRLRYVSKVAILWSDFSYYECKDDSDEYCVSGTLKECGELVKRLSFPNINMPSAKLLWLTENCVNVTELGLPPRVYFHQSQLKRIIFIMTHLEKLDICWSENIKPLLKICAHLKELTIHIKKFKSKSPAWELEKWANEGVYFPPVVRIFAPLDYCCNWYDFLSRHCTILPANELYIYSSARIPMDIHPKLPLLRFRFGSTAASPVVKASDYGILGLSNDFMNVLEFNYDGKVMHGMVLSKLSSSNQKYLDLRFSTLNSIVFFSVRNSKIIFPGHLEQIAIACPNLQWLNLCDCYNSLQNLKGLQSIVNMCENLQGLNIAKIRLVNVESYTLLWQVISSMPKLTHLTLSLCLHVIPKDVRTERMVIIFQNCLNLQALEIDGLSHGRGPLLLSSFPSLAYCKLSYNDDLGILQNTMATCKNLKVFYYDNDYCPRRVPLVPQSCVCNLQQLCIESKFMDIPDSFMDMISSHGQWRI